MQYFYAEYKILFQKHLEELAAHGLLNNLQQLVRVSFNLNFWIFMFSEESLCPVNSVWPLKCWKAMIMVWWQAY